MEEEKFKVGTRCFVEGEIIQRLDALSKEYPVKVKVPISTDNIISFTSKGVFCVDDKKQYLFTTDEVAEKLYPDLAAEIERLASRVNELETIDNGIYQKLELAELQIAKMNEAHGQELEKLNSQIQLLSRIIIKIAKQ